MHNEIKQNDKIKQVLDFARTDTLKLIQIKPYQFVTSSEVEMHNEVKQNNNKIGSKGLRPQLHQNGLALFFSNCPLILKPSPQ
jgi:hypothetical protein